MGALTAIGLSPDAFWNGLMERRSGAAPITRFDASDFETRFACELQGFDPADFDIDRKLARRSDPVHLYALAAATQAVRAAGIDRLSESERARIGVVIGSGVGGLRLLEQEAATLAEKGPSRVTPFLVPMMIANMSGGLVAIEHGLRGPNHAVTSACATGNDAIATGTMLLRGGYAEAVVVGGTEAPITQLSIAGFGAMKALSRRNDDPDTASRPFDVGRDGFVAGEGAGALVLETLAHAEARGAEPLAEVLGFGASDDAFHIAAPHPEGRGAESAMRACLADAGVEPEAVDHISLHATSTPVGDPIEAAAVRRVFGDHASRIASFGPKAAIGHTLGAAGAVEAVAAVQAILHQTAPPTVNTREVEPDVGLDLVLDGPRERRIETVLSNAFGFGGHNTTVAFGRMR